MKKIFLFFVPSLFIVMSCGPVDKQTQLEQLKKERDDLNQQIKTIEAELEAEGVDLDKESKYSVVEVLKLKKQVFKHYIEVQGTVESDKNVFIPAESPGVVKKIHVKAGQKVSKGQLLAELDGSVYERSIDEIKNGLELATKVFEKQQNLWNQKIGSEIQYLQAKNNKEALEKSLATVMEQYDMTKIKSPISGTVDEIIIKEGEMAMAGLGAIRVVKLDELKIKATLSEEYIDNVKKGDLVKINIPSLDVIFEREIDAVSNVIDPDTRTFSIEIRIPNDLNLKPNMLAVLSINDYTNEEAIIVPLNIVQKTADSKFLFISEKDKEGNTIARLRNISIGKSYGGKTEVTESLSEGELIITRGFQGVADGNLIMIK